MPVPAGGPTLAARFRSLGHRNFRLYWIGQLVSLVGTWMQSVAQGWLMHRLTDSAFMLGLLGFMQSLPVLLFSLWAGVVADRVDKRRLLYLTQGAALLQAAVLAAAVLNGAVRPWMVLALAFVFGVINAFDLPVRQSFLVELVGKEDLSNAIALNSAAFNAARVIGPAFSDVRLTQALDRWGFGRNLLLGLSTAGIGLAIFAWSRTLPLSIAGGFLAGFGLIVYVASTNTLLQQTTEDRFRGRVMSLYTLMFVGTAPIGALASGAIAQRWGAPLATSFSAVVLLGGALWVSYRLRVLAARESTPTPEPAVVEKIG